MSANRTIRPRRYLRIAVKYWRMNPWRHWWILHVWDEIRADWTGERPRRGLEDV